MQKLIFSQHCLFQNNAVDFLRFRLNSYNLSFYLKIINFQYLPFDEQICKLDIESYKYTTQDISKNCIFPIENIHHFV